MISKIFSIVALSVCLALPARGAILYNYHKGAGTGEIFYLHPTTALCTKRASTSTATGFSPTIRFDSMDPSTGCKVAFTGLVSSNMADFGYTLTFRVFFSTATQSTAKVVGLGVRAWAMVRSGSTGAGVERHTDLTQTTVASSSRTWAANQVQSLDVDVAILKPDGSACDSACDNTELFVVIEPTASMTIPAGDFYLLGYKPLWSH